MRILALLIITASAHAQLSDAIVWRYGLAPHIGVSTNSEGLEFVNEWPVAPCGHEGHDQRGFGPRPTDEQFEALRLEYLASPEYATRQAAREEMRRNQADLPDHQETVRELEALAESLVEAGLLEAAALSQRTRSRINRRRQRRGDPEL